MESLLTSNTAVLWKSFYLSSLSTVGFFFAYFFALFLMLIIRLKSTKPVMIKDKEQGKFGWVMVFVEFIDALPEAAMLAQISVNNLSSASLLASLFVMNFANGFSTTFDIMATIKSKLVDVLMFIILHFSVGLLSYAISVSVYAHVGEELAHNKSTVDDLYLLYAGTCVGSLFVVCNMAFHHWTEETFSKVKLETDSQSEALLSDSHFDTYLSFATKEENDHDEHDELKNDRKKFFVKIIQTFIILLVLYMWTVGWSLIITGIFLFFRSPENFYILNLVGSFLEGLGGGAFLSTIACTILVKINECYDSMNITNRSCDKWKKIIATAMRTFFFIAGLIVANIIDIYTN